MGLFSSNKDIKEIFPWIQLTSMDQLNLAFNNSSERPILLFKHSTRCSISSMAKARFENNWHVENNNCDLYFLDLLAYRAISDEIEKITRVDHQSPQAILIKNKEVLYEDSHTSISAAEIEKIVNA